MEEERLKERGKEKEEKKERERGGKGWMEWEMGRVKKKERGKERKRKCGYIERKRMRSRERGR